MQSKDRQLKKDSIAVSWSGGKDSCLALYKALQKGYKVKYLFNTISDDYQRVRFHGVRAEIIQKQAEALGIRLYQKETSGIEYENECVEALRQLKDKVGTLVFGDIHLSNCFAFAKRVSEKVDMSLYEPLWKIGAEALFREFVDAGFTAIVVSTQGSILDASWVGRTLDNDFLSDIKQHKSIDVSGENGEYHTLVLDGPIFKKKLILTKTEKVPRGGYWFLDIQKCSLKEKQ